MRACVCVVVVELRAAAEDRERMKEVEEAVAREVQRNLADVQAKNVQVRQSLVFSSLLQQSIDYSIYVTTSYYYYSSFLLFLLYFHLPNYTYLLVLNLLILFLPLVSLFVLLI